MCGGTPAFAPVMIADDRPPQRRPKRQLQLLTLP